LNTLARKERIEESEITDKIKDATTAIAGEGSGISFNPITLEVVRMGAPDLTMVDLPGITRVPIPGQPPDIYEQISEMIIHYITPNESIILNVISADVDFSTCESIKMSKAVDERGERTLAVVTKCDRAAEGLLEKVTMNAVNIRLGYVCVRNRIDNETNEEARKKEKALFESHPKLKKIDKSIVGIPVLATKLMHIQGRSINKSLPTIVKKIDSMLSERQAELTNLPQHLCNPREADVAFVKVLTQ
jgi:GTP-binding protein EngB required for normal cell division